MEIGLLEKRIVEICKRSELARRVENILIWKVWEIEISREPKFIDMEFLTPAESVTRTLRKLKNSSVWVQIECQRQKEGLFAKDNSSEKPEATTEPSDGMLRFGKRKYK